MGCAINESWIRSDYRTAPTTPPTKEEKMNKIIEDIIEDIRELRDADFHVCKHSEWQSKGEPETTDDITCTCGEFDKVIDKLEELKSGGSNDNR